MLSLRLKCFFYNLIEFARVLTLLPQFILFCFSPKDHGRVIPLTKQTAP